MAAEVFGSLRLSGCEDERESAITESSVPCWPKVSGDGNPCYEKCFNQYNGKHVCMEHKELTCVPPPDMSTSKLFARLLLGGKVSAERALLRDCCKMTEPVQGGSIADSQLMIDEERSLEVDKEVIWKLYNGAAGES